MKKILKNTWLILTEKERRQFSTLIGASIIISIVDIVALALLLWIVQFYIQPGNNTLLSFLPDWLNSKESIWPIAIFFVFFALKNTVAFFIDRAYYRFNGRVAIRISTNKLINYQHADYKDFIAIDSSEHIRSICLQPFEFCQYILTGIQQLITQLCLITIAVLAIFFIQR